MSENSSAQTLVDHATAGLNAGCSVALQIAGAAEAQFIGSVSFETGVVSLVTATGNNVYIAAHALIGVTVFPHVKPDHDYRYD